jgi:hypothetical protein
VDIRLATIGTSRPGKLRKQDIPNLASALVGYWKGLGTLDAGSSKNISYVRLYGPNFDVLVAGEDWVKVLPFLQDGTLGPGLFPSPGAVVDPTVLQAGKDFGDSTLYNRTLSTLTTIFADAEAYPTQNVQRGFTPSIVPGLFAHLDASRSTSVSLVGPSVSLWKENVRGQNAFQMSPAARPVFNPIALNNLPGIEFDGTQWLDFPLQAMRDWSVFIVGKYQESLTQTMGGLLVAAGFEGLGSGLDCYIKQNNAVAPLPGPEGRLSTWLFGDFAPVSPYNDAVAPDTFRLLSWSQSSQKPGGSRARLGLNQDVDLAGIAASTPYDLIQEGWDPTRQRAGNPSPLFGAIGRYSGLLAGGPTFYLVGTICEILIYNRQLSTVEFNQIAASLSTKWGGALL